MSKIHQMFATIMTKLEKLDGIESDVKFNFYQDQENVRTHTRKLKGTNIGISEQYPKEIESIRKTLYPELKKAKAEGKRAKIVRDKLIIDGRIFNNRS